MIPSVSSILFMHVTFVYQTEKLSLVMETSIPADYVHNVHQKYRPCQLYESNE